MAHVSAPPQPEDANFLFKVYTPSALGDTLSLTVVYRVLSRSSTDGNSNQTSCLVT